AQGDLRPAADDGRAPGAYGAPMRPMSRRALWLSAVGLGVFQVAGSLGAAKDQPDRRAVDWLAIVLLLLGPAALARRDRWPLVAVAVTGAVTDLYVGLGYPYGPVFFSFAIAVFVAIQGGYSRSTRWLAALAYGGFVVASIVGWGAPDHSAVHLALVAGWLVVVLAVSEVARVRHDQGVERKQAEHDERQRRLGEQRLRLAQELHDVLAHNISLINVQAGVALHLIDDEPERARPALANIKAASREALRELRTALDVLRNGEEAPRAPAPGLADLDTLVEGVRSSGLEVHLECGTWPRPLPAAVELAAYRIVQEALTNVTRHARARVVTVRVEPREQGGLTVEVVDDGVGGPAEPGNGIAGMSERAAALGGTVAARARPDGGFLVLADLPAGPA
ncbi:MAG: histidine kinase, partial [Acidimicrobiales bacterium]|nr:histidine kinase [Acidimicrobiales bacterium]